MKRNKWMVALLGLAVLSTNVGAYKAPLVNEVYATGNNDTTTTNYKFTIGNIKVINTPSGLTPGAGYSVDLEVNVDSEELPEGSQQLGYLQATANGQEVSISGDTDVPLGSNPVCRIRVSGMVYQGEESVDITINAIDPTGNITDSQTVSAKVSGYSAEEVSEGLKVENTSTQINAGETSNISFKIKNSGKINIGTTEAKLTLDKSVEGLKIQNGSCKISGLSQGSVKNASFSVSASKDVMSGVYPAKLTVSGKEFPVKIQVDSNLVPSALEIGLVNNETYGPGTTKDAVIQISNVGGKAAKNIRVEFANTENISIMSSGNVKRISQLNAKSSQNISLKIKISKDFKGDSLALPINITYLNSEGETEEDKQYIYLPSTTQASEAPAEVIVSNVISPTGTFGVDQNFNVKFNVKAIHSAKNIQVSVEGDEGIVPKSQNLFNIQSLNAGQSKQYTVALAATREAVSSSHPIKIVVTYGDDPEKLTTMTQYGSVNIKNAKKDAEDAKQDNPDGDDEKLKGKPKVIIGNYKIEPQIVQAGEEFQLTLGFKNTNKKHSVHNLKANILPVQQETAEKAEDTGNVFTPVDGSNTIFISDLACGEEKTEVLKMYTIPSAVAKTYQITVQMAYEDEDGNEIEATETLGIPVEQVTKIDIDDISDMQAAVGEMTPFSITFYNRGRTNVSNMMVYLKKSDDFSVEENKSFIGNFAIGESQTYEVNLTPNIAGEIPATLVVEYEDPSGKAQTLEYDFNIIAEEMMIDDGMMDPDMMDDNMGIEEPKKPIGKIAGIVGGIVVVIAAVITSVVLMKKKKKKEEMMFDEED